MQPVEEMPPALPSMWRALKRGYRAEPLMLPLALGFSLLAALPDALMALWLKLLADGVLAKNRRLLLGAAVGLGISTAGTWFLRVISDRVQRRFRDRLTIALESQVADLQASAVTIAHQERPEYLDRLAMLRDQVFVLDHMYMSLFSTFGWILRLGVTIALLCSIHPALGLLALFAIPTVLTSSWRPGAERKAEEAGAPARRLARHLFEVATTTAPGKEVRVTGIGEKLTNLRRSTWDIWYRSVSRARWMSAVFHMMAWTVFGTGYLGAVVFVAAIMKGSSAQVLLVLAAGSRLSAYIGATVGEIGFLRGFWLEGSRRLAWLEDYTAALADHADVEVPKSLSDGIVIEHLSFSHPGSERAALKNVSVKLPAGSVVAVVGENGAGKSTLVKLLCRMYTPDSGRILVDGRDLGRMPATEWRSRLAGAFQDFFRFEFRARDTVGLGDVTRLGDLKAVSAAIERGGADEVIQNLGSGLETQLGKTWPAGVELSFGQWQKLALARGFMREHPLLLVLDEPTAALDAETEHALFERFAAAARDGKTQQDGNGRITLLVSHRFSTVRMADLIVVMNGAEVVEVGSHNELMALGGTYSELYRIQAAAYRHIPAKEQAQRSEA
ncbi:MAG TPA: ABC transporter ATP-binding protein [Verrucomicrobiae bacterium]|nr:ABC transporter ATP-binding protein [Verrucomicrobiae bacterium]